MIMIIIEELLIYPRQSLHLADNDNYRGVPLLHKFFLWQIYQLYDISRHSNLSKRSVIGSNIDKPIQGMPTKISATWIRGLVCDLQLLTLPPISIIVQTDTLN